MQSLGGIERAGAADELILLIPGHGDSGADEVVIGASEALSSEVGEVPSQVAVKLYRDWHGIEIFSLDSVNVNLALR
jgi:hypothetical protein